MDNEQNNTPYQGAYTGEQIDQAIQKALEPHVEKFNGRTGTVLPQKGDYKAEQIDLDPVSGLTADNLQEAVTELFTSVSEGKSLIASAVTDKGIPTEADAPFETMRDTYFQQGGQLIYSMWDGYLQPDHADRDLLRYIGSRKIVHLHTSGHAGRDTVKALIDGLRPAALLPIHCEAEDRDEFLSLHGSCLMLNDGQRWEVGSCLNC